MDTSNFQLLSVLLAFHDNHPFLTALILPFYASGVVICYLVLCTSPPGGRTIPWLPRIFLTDGILVCCCPLAAVLPVILWPLVAVCYVLLWATLVAFHVLLACLLWFLAAPTFCGIRRGAFIGLYMACAERLRRRGRDLRDGKQRRPLLPVANGGPASEPGTDYGAVNGSRTRFEQEQYSSLTSQDMQYARQPPCQSDAASVISAPPPYQE